MAPFSPFPRALPRGKNCGGTPKMQVLYCSPSVSPLDSARRAPRTERGYNHSKYAGKKLEYEIPLQLNVVGARLSRAAPGRSGPFLVLFFARFLSRALASQRGLHTLFLARLQVEGV